MLQQNLKRAVFGSALSLTLLLAQPVKAQENDSLKIVVLEGEDGVNIIQKKTAVRPVVEVRDKNNLPVAGAAVVFTLPGAGASGVFANGAKTMSLVTDSAGRAATTAIKPIGTGTFKISVSASVQGQVGSTSIAQTNYLTAAAAHAASASAGNSASGGGAGGGAGGSGAAAGSAVTSVGMSTAAIGGVVAGAGAAIGVGAAVATGAIGGGGSGGSTKNCDAQANKVLSDVNSLQSCVSSTATSNAQCLSLANSGLSDLGQLCSCSGGVSASAFPSSLQPYLSQIKTLAPQYNLTLPSSCGF